MYKFSVFANQHLYVTTHAGCLSVSKRRAFATLYKSTIELIGIWGLSNV